MQEVPANEGEPGAAEGALKEEHQEAEPDQQVAEALADLRGDASRPGEVSFGAPESGVQDPAAVQRAGGNQVEDAQDQVDVTQPGGDAVDVTRRMSHRDQDEDHAEADRHERPGD